MNKICLTGRITIEPELKQTANGINFVNFQLAVKREYKNKSGEYETDFFNCTAWKNSGDYIAKYVKKGNLLAIVGRLQNNISIKNDQKNVFTTIQVESVNNITPRNENATAQNFQNNAYKTNSSYNATNYTYQEQKAQNQPNNSQRRAYTSNYSTAGEQEPRINTQKEQKQSFDFGQLNDLDLPF